MRSKKHLKMWVEEMLTNDEISPEEEGFLMGYIDLDE